LFIISHASYSLFLWCACSDLPQTKIVQGRIEVLYYMSLNSPDISLNVMHVDIVVWCLYANKLLNDTEYEVCKQYRIHCCFCNSLYMGGLN